MKVHRRAFAVLAVIGGLCAGNAALAQDSVLRVVSHANLSILDPIWSTTYISRNHGCMIYDTLFGTDEHGKVRPQMVESWSEPPTIACGPSSCAHRSNATTASRSPART